MQFFPYPLASRKIQRTPTRCDKVQAINSPSHLCNTPKKFQESEKGKLIFFGCHIKWCGESIIFMCYVIFRIDCQFSRFRPNKCVTFMREKCECVNATLSIKLSTLLQFISFSVQNFISLHMCQTMKTHDTTEYYVCALCMLRNGISDKQRTMKRKRKPVRRQQWTFVSRQHRQANRKKRKTIF